MTELGSRDAPYWTAGSQKSKQVGSAAGKMGSEDRER